MSKDGASERGREPVGTAQPSPRGGASRPSRSLRASLTYLSAALIIIPAIVSGIVLGFGARSALEQQVYRHLQDVCDAKAQEIRVRLESWLSGLNRFSHRPLLLDSIMEVNDPNLPASVRTRARQTLDWMMYDLTLRMKIPKGDALVVDIADGRPLAYWGLTDQQARVAAAIHPLSELRQYRQPGISEPYLDPVTSQVVFDAIRVLPRFPDESGPSIAILILRLYAPRALYPTVAHVSALGSSAEAQILDRQGRLLTKLGHSSQSLMQKGGPLAQHLSGAEGNVTMGRDYRGVLALAAQAEISLTGWRVTYKVDAAEALAGVTRLTVLWGALLALLLVGGLLLAYSTARRMSQPVLEVSRAARKVAEGELETRVHLDRNDELGVLADDFNYMADRMVVNQQELEQQVLARTAELSAANEHLRRLNEEMTSFTYSVSHDLSAPLVSLQGLTGMLLRDYSDKLDEEGLRRLGRLQTNVQNMEALVSDLLELSRIGRLVGHETDLDVLPLARQALSTFTDLVTETKAEVILPAACPLVRADAKRVTQILANLFGNALKYRDPARPPRLELRCRQVGDGWVEFAVADNGTGFDSSHAERVFQPFQRLSEARKHPGTGMGLAIVRKIVEQYGGSIWAEAAAGQGAQFFFTLPGAGDQDA